MVRFDSATAMDDFEARNSLQDDKEFEFFDPILIRTELRGSKSEISFVKLAVEELNESIEILNKETGIPYSRKLGEWIKFKNAYRKFKDAARTVRKHCQEIQKHFEVTDAQLQFPVFPERCGRLTYLSAKIWILTFALKEISEEIRDPIEIKDLNTSFAKLVNEAVKVRTVVKEFAPQLFGITIAAMDVLQEAAIQLESHFHDVSFQRKASERQEPPSGREALLPGCKMEDAGLYYLIKLYMRTNLKRKWFRFGVFHPKGRLKLIEDGISQVAHSLKIIRKQFRALQKFSERPDSCCHTTLEKSTKNMKSELGTMLDNSLEFLPPSIVRAGITIRKTTALIYSLQLNGRKLLVQILEVEAITRLCYKFILDGLQLPFCPFKDAVPVLLKESIDSIEDEEDEDDMYGEFETKDFFRTPYSETLRKVPIIVNQIELCLQ